MGCLKTGLAQKLLVRVKFAGSMYSYRTRINVNGCHWNTSKLLFTVTCNLYSDWTCTRINVSVASVPLSSLVWIACEYSITLQPIFVLLGRDWVILVVWPSD